MLILGNFKLGLLGFMVYSKWFGTAGHRKLSNIVCIKHLNNNPGDTDHRYAETKQCHTWSFYRLYMQPNSEGLLLHICYSIYLLYPIANILENFHDHAQTEISLFYQLNDFRHSQFIDNQFLKTQTFLYHHGVDIWCSDWNVWATSGWIDIQRFISSNHNVSNIFIYEQIPAKLISN